MTLQINKIYDNIILSNSAVNLNEQKPFLDLIDLKPNSKILDIGTATGIHMEYFANRGLIPFGIDLDDKNFLFHGVYDFIETSSETANFEPESFDYIFASHILEHMGNPLATLHLWRKWLKPNGMLILIVPPYMANVANAHWNIGWNIGQLAMFLVASGFDCSKSTFKIIGWNVCGFGIKKEIPFTNFIIESSLLYLPKGLCETRFVDESGLDYLNGDLIEASPTRYIKPNHFESDFSKLTTYLLNSKSWKITRPLRKIYTYIKRKC